MSKRYVVRTRLASNLADAPGYDELADADRNEDAWRQLSEKLKLRHSWRGKIKLARDGDGRAALDLLNAIYWLVGDGDKTQWPNELRGYLLDCLDAVLTSGESLDKAFSIGQGKLRAASPLDKELRDSQLARMVRWRHVVGGMTLTAAWGDVEQAGLSLCKQAGAVANGSITKAYYRYYKKQRKSM